jgi:hypothetical protein
VAGRPRLFGLAFIDICEYWFSPASQLYERAIPRMEQIIATLESCFRQRGLEMKNWQDRGVMPTLATDALTYGKMQPKRPK